MIDINYDLPLFFYLHFLSCFRFLLFTLLWVHEYCGWIDLVGRREFWRGPNRQMIGIDETISYRIGVFSFNF